MMSGPEPDCTDEVTRAWMSLALIVSTVSLMPSAFWHSAVISPLSSTSEAGTKSAQRSQWTVCAWANAGAWPLAKIAAKPPVFAATAPAPDNCKSLRREIRAMVSSPNVCAALRGARACSGRIRWFVRNRSLKGRARAAGCRASLRRDAGDLNDLGPAIELAVHHGQELSRRVVGRLGAELGEAFAQRGRGQHLDQAGMDLLDHRRRHAGRAEPALPNLDVVARDGLADRRHVGQHRGALGRGDRDRTHRAALNLRHDLGHGVERHRHL